MLPFSCIFKVETSQESEMNTLEHDENKKNPALSYSDPKKGPTSLLFVYFDPVVVEKNGGVRPDRDRNQMLSKSVKLVRFRISQGSGEGKTIHFRA